MWHFLLLNLYSLISGDKSGPHWIWWSSNFIRRLNGNFSFDLTQILGGESWLFVLQLQLFGSLISPLAYLDIAHSFGEVLLLFSWNSTQRWWHWYVVISDFCRNTLCNLMIFTIVKILLNRSSIFHPPYWNAPALKFFIYHLLVGY